jgi:hypothetical protein
MRRFLVRNKNTKWAMLITRQHDFALRCVSPREARQLDVYAP